MIGRSTKTLTVYKNLTVTGLSIYQNFRWPLPDGDTPGEWVEVQGAPSLCSNGLHGWLTETTALRHANDGPLIYEMEIEGPVIEKDHEKACANRGRLVRLLHDRNGPVIPLSELVWQ